MLLRWPRPGARTTWQGLPFIPTLILLTVVNTALFCWIYHPYAGSLPTHQLFVPGSGPLSGQAWNGTFHFLRPQWSTLMEFLEVCADFDGSEQRGADEKGPAPWIRRMQVIFSFPGPSFSTATTALNAYEKAARNGQHQGPYTCTPWVSGVASPQASVLQPMSATQNARIAMVTLSTANLLDKAAVTIALKDKQEYCDRHGYDFHTITETVEGRDAAWAKLPGILSLLPRYEWIFSLDLDTVIYDHSIRLEEFLDPNHDMVIGLDYNGINSGVFFLRNSTWSRALLTEAWTITKEAMSHVWWEQSALMRLVKNEGVRNHIKYCPQMYFNSYISSEHSVNMQENNERGPFIVHFAGVGTKWDILPRFHAQRKNVHKGVDKKASVETE